ncbi:Gfo/Idh/MocA family protein [Amylibacter marinus]|nr:Gfo/Idh/MocA family oxidoreductase [Amylibacter marinus]
MEKTQSNGGPLGVALIGAGMVAGTHMAAILDAAKSVKLCGVYARNSAKAANLIAQHPAASHAKVYEDLSEIATDPDVDIAIVVTPPNARAQIIAPLAKAGKHILLEKPIARTVPEAQEVVEICAAAEVSLGIVFQHRFRAASQQALKLVAGGTLGHLGMVQVNVPYWRDQGYYDALGRGTYARDGGGVMISQAIHTMDLMLALTGPVERVQAMTATTRFHTMESEDFVSAGVTFTNGAVGAITASTAAFPGGAEAITLQYENASLHLEAGVLTLNWRDGRIETYGAVASTGGGADPMAFTHAWHQSVIEDFADTIRRSTPATVSGQTALAVHKLIQAIETSGKTGTTTMVPQ